MMGKQETVRERQRTAKSKTVGQAGFGPCIFLKAENTAKPPGTAVNAKDLFASQRPQRRLTEAQNRCVLTYQKL